MGLRDDEQEITALFEAGDRALMNADIAVLSQIFADDYVQYDASGKAFSKRVVLENLRTSAVRYPSIVSTGRRIRVFGDMGGGDLQDVLAAADWIKQTGYVDPKKLIVMAKRSALSG